MKIVDIVRTNKEQIEAFNRNWVQSATFLNEKYNTNYTNEQVRIAYKNAQKCNRDF